MEAYFKFKGRDSREFGILIAGMPEIIKPTRRVREVMISGRNGGLSVDEGCYDGYTLSVECGKRGREGLEAMAAWLDGSGELILSTEPNRVYRARVSNSIAIADVVYLYNSFLVQFSVFPFKYSVNAFGEGLILTQGGKVYNHGTIYSEPTMTVYGTGDMSLTVNGEVFPLTGVMGSVTIDSERMEVYKGQENCNNKYGAMGFPRFQVGENRIDWYGSVTRVEVTPKWRWL